MFLWAGQKTNQSAVMAPDGHPAWLIECDSKPGNCIREAAKICPRGYHSISVGAENTHSQVNTGKVILPVDSFSGSLLIRCESE